MDIANGKFLLGDCFEHMANIPDGSVDMVLCDLPYGTTQNKWDSVLPLDRLWAEYWRVAKPNAAIVLTASQPFTSILITSQLKTFKHEWIWLKNRGSNFANTVREPFKEHESVLVFSTGGWTYNRQMQERTGLGVGAHLRRYPKKMSNKSSNYGEVKFRPEVLTELRVPTSYQRFDVERGLHPTQKPVALFEYLIRTYTNPGEIVLDNTAGSGTTAIAAERSGRRWVCIERDEGYYAKAVDRVKTEVPCWDLV